MQLRFSKAFYGRLVIFSSTFCFYLSTVFARWATSKEVGLSSAFLTFGRFFLGFFLICGLLLLKRQRPRPRQYHILFGRAVANTFAVFFLYKAVEMTTVAQANILNMTYPMFIALISWFVFRAQRDILAVAMAFIAFGGIVLVLSPAALRFEGNSLWGLASGVISAIAVIFLKLAREQNDTETILLILFSVGGILMFAGFHGQFHIPNAKELFYLVGCGSMGILGQYLITLGYRYVSAVEGGIISSFLIFLAAIFGPVMTADPALAFSGWLGAIIIFSTNLYFIFRSAGSGR